MTWHNDIKPESKAQYISVLMSAFYQQKMHHDKPGMSTSTLPQKDWERECIDKICTSALMADLNTVVKTIIAGAVDIIQEDVLRVECDSTHVVDMRGVNRAIGQITNYSFSGQGKAKKCRKKTKRTEKAPCFRRGTIGHWEE